jgi:hypothetical protein
VRKSISQHEGDCVVRASARDCGAGEVADTTKLDYQTIPIKINPALVAQASGL